MHYKTLILIVLVCISPVIYSDVYADNVAVETCQKKKKRVLKKNKSFSEQVFQPNTRYIVKYDFDLDGETVYLPEGCEIIFNKNGRIENGFLKGDDANLTLSLSNIGLCNNMIHTPDILKKQFSMIEGVDNITLNLTGDCILSGKVDLRFVNLSICGNGNQLILNDFKEISVESLSMVDCNVSSIGATTSLLFRLLMGGKCPSITFRNNTFTGNMRLITSDYKSLDKYKRVRLFEFCDNRLENFYCGYGSNVFVMMPDTLYESIIIDSNIFHNFTCNIFNFACTNNTKYASLAQETADELGRNVQITNNHIYNSPEFMHWKQKNITDTGTYFCMTICEYGSCVCENNVFENLIANNSITNSYDNYLSVSKLVYRNNYCKNILNLGSKDNRVLLKSKMGNGTRLYENNTYVVEDLSDFYGVNDIGLLYTSIFDFQDDIETFEFVGNKLSVAALYLNAYIGNECKNFIFKNNEIKIGEVYLSGLPAYFTVPSRSDFYMEVTGNTISVSNGINSKSSKSDLPFIRDIAVEENKGEIIIKNNILNLCKSLYSGSSKAKSYVGEFADNMLMAGNLNGNVNEFMVTYLPNGLYVSNNNFIYDEIKPVQYSVFNFVQRFNSSCSFSSNLRFDKKPSNICIFRSAKAYGNVGTYKLIVEIESKEKHYLFEYNYHYAGNGISEYYAYDKNGYAGFVTSNTEIPNLYDVGNGCAILSLNNGLRGDFLQERIDYKIKVTIEPLEDITKMYNLYPMSKLSTISHN